MELKDAFRETRHGLGLDYIKATEYLIWQHRFVSVGNTIWYYDKENGIYRDDQGTVDSLLVDFIHAGGIATGTTNHVRELRQQIAGKSLQREFPFDNTPNIIPVANGVIRLDAEPPPIHPDGADYIPKLHGHGHEWMITKRLDATYDPDVDTSELVELLQEWLPENDEWKILIQIPALAIMQSWGQVYKIAYLLEGQRDAGKSTYCTLLMSTFGEAGYSMVELSDLIRNRFSKYQLLGKFINIQDDLAAVPLRHIGRFKDLTGKTSHEVERKGHQGYVAKLTALHLYTCNHPPSVDFVDDDAFWSRWVYLTFTGRFARDPRVAERILSEEMRSALLKLVVDEIIEILRDPHRVHRMDPDEVKRMWTLAVDSLAQYLNERCERSADAVIPKDDIYHDYIQWCEATSKTAEDKAVLTRALSRMGVTTTKVRLGGKRVQAYRGIKIAPRHQEQSGLEKNWTPLDDYDNPFDRYDQDMAMEPEWSD